MGVYAKPYCALQAAVRCHGIFTRLGIQSKMDIVNATNGKTIRYKPDMQVEEEGAVRRLMTSESDTPVGSLQCSSTRTSDASMHWAWQA